MTQILEVLNRLESKVDNLHPAAHSDGVVVDGDSRASSTPARALTAPLRIEQLSAAHRVMLWPTIYLHLISNSSVAASDLQLIMQHGSSWLIAQEARHSKEMDNAANLQSTPVGIAKDAHSTNIKFPWLTIQQVQALSEAYFHTFNVLCPIIDQDPFTNDVVSPLLRDGYGMASANSILALLVFALGQVALEGTLNQPLDGINGEISGIRGGSRERPPGLELFNEARKRLGFITSDCTIAGVQSHLLQALYYGANSMALEAWKSATSASTACQLLLRTTSVDWNSPDSDLLRRVYWTCHLMESLFRFDLCLPSTGIQSLQQTVPLPGDIHSAWSNDNRPHHELYFHAVLTLEKLISDVNLTILERTSFSILPLTHDTDNLSQLLLSRAR